MRYDKFFKLIRHKTRTNTSTFTTDDIIDVANLIKDEIVQAVIKQDEDYFVMPFLRDLRAGQKEYYLPNRMLANIKQLEIDIDGDGKYSEGTEVDLNMQKRHYIRTDDSEFQEIDAGDKVAYRLSRDSLILVTNETIIDVYDGLRLHCLAYPKDLESGDEAKTIDMSVDPTSTEFGIPRAIHGIWLRKVTKWYKESREKPIPLDEDEKMVDQKFEDFLATLSPQNLDREDVGEVPYDDGTNY